MILQLLVVGVIQFWVLKVVGILVMLMLFLIVIGMFSSGVVLLVVCCLLVVVVLVSVDLVSIIWKVFNVGWFILIVCRECCINFLDVIVWVVSWQSRLVRVGRCWLLELEMVLVFDLEVLIMGYEIIGVDICDVVVGCKIIVMWLYWDWVVVLCQYKFGEVDWIVILLICDYGLVCVVVKGV